MCLLRTKIPDPSRDQAPAIVIRRSQSNAATCLGTEIIERKSGGDINLGLVIHDPFHGSTYPELWLNARTTMPPVAHDTGAHVCLRARTIAAVDAFHAEALANGGTNDGAPGPRQATRVTYYGAFVRDLDGNRIEVMTVPPESNLKAI